MTDDLSRRQLLRQEQREISALADTLANKLMKLTDAAVNKLGLEDDLAAAVVRARKVTANVARRRAERELAGVLRGADMNVVAQRLANVQISGTGASPKRKA